MKCHCFSVVIQCFVLFRTPAEGRKDGRTDGRTSGKKGRKEGIQERRKKKDFANGFKKERRTDGRTEEVEEGKTQ